MKEDRNVTFFRALFFMGQAPAPDRTDAVAAPTPASTGLSDEALRVLLISILAGFARGAANVLSVEGLVHAREFAGHGAESEDAFVRRLGHTVSTLVDMEQARRVHPLI